VAVSNSGWMLKTLLRFQYSFSMLVIEVIAITESIHRTQCIFEILGKLNKVRTCIHTAAITIKDFISKLLVLFLLTRHFSLYKSCE
jgi:hypothetical protein